MLVRMLQPSTIRKVLVLFLVAGMASLGRQFAYLGLEESTGAPIYVTEIVLAASLYLGFLAYCLSPDLRKILRTAVSTPLVLYWLWGVILLAVALPAYKLDAIRDFVVVYYSLFIFVTIAALRTVRDIELLLYTLAIANTFFVGTVLVDIAGGNFSTWESWGVTYLRLGEGTRGLFSIIGFIIILILYLINVQRRRSWLLLILLPFFVVGILGPQSRSLLVSFAGVVAVLFLLLPQVDRPRLMPILGVALACLLILVIVVPNVATTISAQFTKYQAFFDSEEGSNAARLANYRLAVDDIIASPIWGVGFGTPRVFDYGSSDLPMLVRSPHDSYLGIAFRSGVVGLVLFLAFLAKFYVFAVRGILKTTDLRLRRYAAGILAAQAAVALVAFFNVTLEGPHEGVIFWILIGAEMRILALAESEQRSAAVLMQPIETSRLRGWSPRHLSGEG